MPPRKLWVNNPVRAWYLINLRGYWVTLRRRKPVSKIAGRIRYKSSVLLQREPSGIHKMDRK